MAVHKISLSLEDDAFEVAKAEAAAEGISLSAWLSRAARRQARIARGLRAVAEYEAEFGPIPDEALREADRLLDRFGVGKPQERWG
jgi:hypothetical protein